MRLVRCLILPSLLLAAAAAGGRPLLLYLVQNRLHKDLQAGLVTVRACTGNIVRQVNFSGVHVQKKGSFEFQAGSVTVEYSLWSLLHGRIDRLALQDVTLSDALPGAKQLSIEGADLTVNQNGAPGHLFIRTLKYGKLQVDNIRADTRLQQGDIVLVALTGEVLSGVVKGGLTLKVTKEPVYLAKLQFIELDLTDFVRKFDLKDKVAMSGKLSGSLSLNGHGTKIQILDGDLGASSPGGTMTIKDPDFLQRLAQNTGQPLNIVVDSLKDYHYNTGGVTLKLDQGDLVVNMDLDGEAGKRGINIVVHDFNLK